MKIVRILMIMILIFLCGCERVKVANRNKTEEIECIYGHKYLVKYYNSSDLYSVASHIPLFNDEGKPMKCE